MIKIIGTIIGSIGFGILFTYLDFIVVIGIVLAIMSSSFFVINELHNIINKTNRYQPTENNLGKPPKGSSGAQKPKSESIIIMHDGEMRTVPRANYKVEE
jgi:hypothetical protein